SPPAAAGSQSSETVPLGELLRVGGSRGGPRVYAEVVRGARSQAADSPDQGKILTGDGFRPRSRFRERVHGWRGGRGSLPRILGRALRVRRLWLTGPFGTRRARGSSAAGELRLTCRVSAGGWLRRQQSRGMAVTR